MLNGIVLSRRQYSGLCLNMLLTEHIGAPAQRIVAAIGSLIRLPVGSLPSILFICTRTHQMRLDELNFVLWVYV